VNAHDAILRANPQYVDALLRRYREAPDSVPPSWAGFFAGYDLGLLEGARREGRAASSDGPPIELTAEGDLPEGVDLASVAPALRIYDVVHAHRAYGHLVADLDPLGQSPRENPLLALSEFGFTEDDLDQVVTCETYNGLRQGSVRQFLDALRQTYCSTIGVEMMDALDKQRRDWLVERMEPMRNRPELSREARVGILRDLVAADTFEEWLGKRYPGGKRFSLEGGTTLIPLMNALIEDAACASVEHVVMGMPHRGRLNVLAHVLGKPHAYILAEFEERPLPTELLEHGDVKYHLGYSRTHDAACGRPVRLSLEFNPSHLEAVDPVVEGIVRARQNRLGDADRRRVLPVLLHGDAAVAGQGIVAETFMLAGIESYRTGGTIHVIVNNQVGFTTAPGDTRSTRYCSDIARIARAPVFHVNGDDAEACVHVARLALAYRQEWGADVVIDLTCYRRHGHNELDDPTFTQPVMYALVAAHPTNSRVYAQRLIAEGVVAGDEVDAMAREVVDRMDAAHASAKAMPHRHVERPGPEWEGLGLPGDDWSAPTAVSRESLERIARALIAVPEGFTWHPRLEKMMRHRADMVLKDQPLDWGCAEALAIGSLLLEGTKVRLTGQDTVRGTFSHRHAAYFDARTGSRHVPLNHLGAEQNVFQIINSPLSEEAVLGFEYGYSTADPWTLACWEAQFGDFVNGAQVILDQFLASGEHKWGRRSGLVLLLPHGLEGQGPEHSSARLERFLELCSEKNLQVCNVTTPAQYFHLLRRQVRRTFRKPLVIMTPKSLLRHDLATSRVADLVQGRFEDLIDDAMPEPRRVTRALICSGRIYWVLYKARLERKLDDVAILRLEQLYPFPDAALRRMLPRYRRLQELTWVQEEPQNMGGWRHLRHRLEACLPQGVTLSHAARHSAAVPATGSHDVHAREERDLVEAAFTPRGGKTASPASFEELAAILPDSGPTEPAGNVRKES